MNSYKDLIVWQKSFTLAKEVYRITSFFPSSEMYGLSSQMRRSAVSIPSNIAEGFGRKSKKEQSQFLAIAFGSLNELETQILLAKELAMTNAEKFSVADSLSLEVRKMLSVIRRDL